MMKKITTLMLLFILITMVFSGCVNVKEERTYTVVLPWDLEEAIFDEINSVRVKNNISVLRWNEKVAETTRNHSEDMVARDYYQHTNPEGEDHGDRLLKDGIFFLIAAENLMAYPWGDELYSENTSKEVVEGWLESPLHRSSILDRDELYSDIGIGVSYGEGYYYITANFIGNEREVDTSLDYGYTLFYYLYDPAWDIGFSDEIVAEIEISATQSIDVYIVSDKSEYDNFLKGHVFDYADYYKECQHIDETQRVVIGQGIILSNEYYNAPIDINIKVYYPSDLKHFPMVKSK